MIWIALTFAVSVASGLAYERRRGEAAGTVARRMLRLMLYALVPPVTFLNIAKLEIDADIGGGIALGWVALTLTGVVAWLLGTRVLGLDRPQTGSLINATIQPNTGYLGLPLAAAVLGFASLDEAVAFDVLVGGPALLLGVFGVGAAFGSTSGEGLRERVAAFFTRNPPLAAAALGLLAPDALAPDVLVDISRILVFAMLPMGFFAVGVTLGEERDHGTRIAPFDRRIAIALGLRLVLAPLLLLALAAPLIDLPDTYLLLCAMPAGLNGLIVAHTYGLDLGFTAGAIAWSTGVAIVVGTIAVAFV